MSEKTAVVLTGTADLVTTESNLPEVLPAGGVELVQALNPTFDLSWLRKATMLKTDAKGKFYYDLCGEKIILSDEIHVQLIEGHTIYQLWGEKGTPQEGTLLCVSKDHVTSEYGDCCAECPYGHLDQTSQYYTKCGMRFALQLALLEEGEDPAEPFVINMPLTGTYAFGDYVKLLTKKYKAGASSVVTLMSTETTTGKKDPTQRFNAIKFKYVEPLKK